MSHEQKKEKKDPVKKWFIILGSFFLVQLLFITIDGTILEPNLNRVGNFVSSVIGDALNWFTLYENPFFKFVTLVFVLQMMVTFVKDFILLMRR